MPLFTAFLAGLLFGLGLILSGMSNPAKVLAFLDIGGNWDPSLVCVMAGAIAVSRTGFAIARRRGHAWLDRLHLPTVTRIDRRLIVGSLLFGIGWGLAGYCPGPAFVSLTQGGVKTLAFLTAMLAGMVLHAVASRRGRSTL